MFKSGSGLELESGYGFWLMFESGSGLELKSGYRSWLMFESGSGLELESISNNYREPRTNGISN